MHQQRTALIIKHPGYVDTVVMMESGWTDTYVYSAAPTGVLHTISIGGSSTYDNPDGMKFTSQD